jgi:predicted nucleic acid-binding protein
MAEKKIICDTDVMIDYWDTKNVRHVSTSATLKNIGLDNILLPAITKMELLLGATNKTDLNRINKEIARFNIALINDDITLKAFSLIQKYSLSYGLTLPDSIIASTAIITGLDLFTYNIKDYIFITGAFIIPPTLN